MNEYVNQLLWKWGISLYGSSEMEPGGRAPLLGTLRQVKEGSGNAASLSIGTLHGEPGGRASLLGTLKDI
jgi:hypothetical protein